MSDGTTNGRIRFGLAGLCAQTPSGAREQVHAEIHRLVDVAHLAEAEGLDAVWLSEHHFTSDAYLPSPLPVLAALAVETQRVTLSTNVALAPLYHPLRLAEDCAVIDHLSDGRLMLGLGLGYRAEEFEAIGVDRGARGKLMSSTLRTLKAAWCGNPVSRAAGEPAVVVSPAPWREGGPPVLVGALAEPGIRRAGALADGWIAPPLANVRQAEKRIQWIAEERRDELDDFRVVLTFNGFVAGSDAWDKVRTGALYAERQYRGWLETAGDSHGPKGKKVSDGNGGEDIPQHFVCGDPSSVAAQLRPWCNFLRDLPAGVERHLSIRLTWPNVSEAENFESVRIFAREVVPILTELAA